MGVPIRSSLKKYDLLRVRVIIPYHVHEMSMCFTSHVRQQCTQLIPQFLVNATLAEDVQLDCFPTLFEGIHYIFYDPIDLAFSANGRHNPHFKAG